MTEAKSNFIIHVFLLMGIFIVLCPVIYMLVVAFGSTGSVFVSFIPSRPTLKNFVSVLSDVEIASTYRNSWIISPFTALLTVILASLGGYGLSRFRFKLRAGFILLLLLTQVFPLVLLATSYFHIIIRLGLYNTRMALILLNTTFTVPFCTLLLKSIFDGIPKGIEDAAMIDGCSRVGCFLKIVLPLSWAGVCATAIFAFIQSWSEYLFALTFTTDYNTMPITVEINKLLGHYIVSWGKIMALATLAMIPILVMFTLFQKVLMKGLTAGAVKE